MHLLRKLIHVSMAVVPLVGWFVSYPAALVLASALLLFSLILEIARRCWRWVDRTLWRSAAGLLRSWEQGHVLGSTWFCVGTLAALLLFGRDVGGTAVLFLALGDPVAELAGRWWGRPGSGKTLVGSLACLLACLAVSGAGIALGRLSPAAAVAGAVAATIAERWPPPPSDNVWMPLFSGLVMAAVQQLAMV
jgi:dolichol kinase